MADVARQNPEAIADFSSSMFGKYARAQYGALARMRGRMFVNGLRSTQGVFEFSARTMAYFAYATIGIGMAIGAGAAAFSLVVNHEWNMLPVETWVVLVVWQAMAVGLASFQEQYDLSGLLRFPVSFGSFYALFLIFGLIDISTIIGTLCCSGIVVGIAIANPQIIGWSLLVVALFTVFNALLARAVLAWIDRWLAKRRSRELISVVFVFAVLSLQLLNPALHDHDGQGARPHAHGSGASFWAHRLRHLAAFASGAQEWLPPGLTARAIASAATKDPAGDVESAVLLGLGVLGAGGLLALRLRAEYRGESFGEAPDRKSDSSKTGGWRVAGGPVGAIIEKDLRTLSRSIPQLYSLVVPMLMVLIVGSLFRNNGGVFNENASTGHRSGQFAMPLCVAYGLLGFTQLVYNALGPEGKGIQLLFFAPVRIRYVLLAKNLLHATLYALVAAGSALLACLRLGWPSPVVVVTTVSWILFALPANLAAGNILSITMAYRVNLGRIGRQSGSQGNALLSMLIQTGLLAVGAGVITVCGLLGKQWLAPAILIVCAVIAIFIWLRVLHNSDAMANARRDTLIALLAKTE